MSQTATTVLRSAATQPDISYHPNWEKYIARRDRRVRTESLTKILPAGFPLRLDSPLVWEGADFKDEKEWTLTLDEAQWAEVKEALGHFKALNKPLGSINESTFPLPTLHPILRAQSKELHQGRGFFVLRGIRVDEHTTEENVVIYAGVSSHIGSQRGRQGKALEDGRSEVLAHIKDLSTKEQWNGSIRAPAYTTHKQVFHTDAGDIVSLFALNTAAEGGISRLSSSWRAYNELAETRPDLVRTLAEDWALDNFKATESGYSTRPLLFYQPPDESTGAPEHLIIQYARRLFTGFEAFPRPAEIPPITEAQAEALDTLHFLGEKYNLGLNFQKGDIQYVNNLGVFHARDAFTDQPGKERHLLRLWLRDPEYAWETPAPLRVGWEKLYRNLSEEDQVFPLEPKIRG